MGWVHQESDEELYNGLKWTLENDITDVLECTFSALRTVPKDARDVAGNLKDDDADDEEDDDDDAAVVDLVPGGRDIDVRS